MATVFKIKTFEITIDDIDADLLQSKWHILTHKSSRVYVRKSMYKNGVVRGHLMHRLILSRALGRDLLPSEFCDHIDGNGLNNQRSNLRVATQAQNTFNARVKNTNKLGVKGVRRISPLKYEARITTDGETVSLGYYDSPEEAHAAYMVAAKTHHGEFANGG